VPSAEEVVVGLKKVRQIRDGSLRFVLPTELGSVLIADDVTEEEIHTALRQPTREWSRSALLR
jgi:3-dehydroquinate synthase